MKKLRQSTVEPVLGTLINFLAMKRVNTRGIKLANKCMLMAAVAYNVAHRPSTSLLSFLGSLILLSKDNGNAYDDKNRKATGDVFDNQAVEE